MDHQIKKLAEAITHVHTSSLIHSHVKELVFNEESKHLIIYLDNVAPLHELKTEEGDKHLNKGLEKVYGKDMTYELRVIDGRTHEREKIVSPRVLGYYPTKRK